MAKCISPTVSELLQQYNLTEDVCSRQVSAVHLEEISRSHCKNWRNLPAHLELPEIVNSDIDHKQVQESEKRKEFFSNWQETKGSAATYKSLISALLKIKRRQDAESVCKLLQSSPSIKKSCDKPTPSSSVDTKQATENRFPYLNASDLTENDRVRFVTQLECESEEIRYEFSQLVVRTQQSLKEQRISSKDLACLLKNSTKRHLSKLCDDNPEIPDLICQLSDHWSFFDYDLLGSIIKSCCPELKSDLKEYVKKFEMFCRRRLCELPADIFKTMKHTKNLYVKYDENFGAVTLEQVKKLECKLSKLLHTELYLLEVKEGCIELVFESIENIDDRFLLDESIKASLDQMKVLYIQTNDCLQLPPDNKPQTKNEDDDNTSFGDSGLETGSWASSDSDFDRGLDIDKDPYDPYQDPLKVTKVGALRCPSPSCQQNFPSVSHGKWMLFRNFEDLNETWCAVREAVLSGEFGATGAVCGTLKYNPLQCGAGPVTTQRITVYTMKDDYIDVGMKLIKMKEVQHDIKYKTMKDTNEGALAHAQPKRLHRVTCMTIFWNEGDPYAAVALRPGTRPKHPPCRSHQGKFFDPAKDLWKINVVKGDTSISERLHGKWILELNYDPKSGINVSIMWYLLKAMIEKHELPAIRMECPAEKFRGANPEIHIFISEEHVDTVGDTIARMVEQDISYVVGEGSFHGDEKVLYWNNGEPSYDNMTQARTGILDNWRSQK